MSTICTDIQYLSGASKFSYLCPISYLCLINHKITDGFETLKPCSHDPVRGGGGHLYPQLIFFGKTFVTTS